MARKSFSLTRTPRFKTEDLNVHSNKANPLLSKITRQRLDRSGPVTIAQYRQLWNWESPEFGNSINAYVVKDTRGKLTADVDKKGLGYIKDLPNFHEILDSTVLYTEDRYLMQIFHNLSNINGILYFMKQMGVTPSNVLFDGEFNAVTGKDFIDPTFIRPDGVIIKGNKVVFLETDCGTHEFKTLKDKSELYKKLIDSGVLQEMDFTDISIIIHSHSRRIHGIKKNGCMEPISKYVRYLDFLDNEFNYMDQFGAGGGSYRGAYRGLDRAISKARKQWESGVELLGKKEHEKSFRDPIAFRNKVEALRGNCGDVEDLRDGFEPVVDNEPDSNKRELSAELWVSGKSSED